MQGKLALLDFDGTLISKDSLFLFLRYCSKNTLSFYLKMLQLLPVFMLFKLGFLTNQRTKEIVLKTFLGQKRLKDVEEKAIAFTNQVLPNYLYSAGLEHLNWLKSEGFTIYLVSASAELWLKPWCIQQGIQLISTQLETREELITGQILGENCRAEEKKKRILATIPLEKYEIIHAYGDSSDDYPMFSLAHRRYFKPFRVPGFPQEYTQ